MAQIYIGEDEKIYRTKFEIGDIVRIWELGYCYTTFKRAFQRLGLYDIKEIFLKGVNKNENWVIVDMIVVNAHYNRPHLYDILCHIKNKKGISIVIGEKGLNKRVLNDSITKSLKKLNNNKIKVLV